MDYVDLRGTFWNTGGTLNGNLLGDAIHINAGGLDVWMKGTWARFGR